MTTPDDVSSLLLPADSMPAGMPDAYDTPVSRLIRPAAEVTRRPLARIVGVPFDTTTMHRRGSRFGPAAVRAELATCLTYNPSFDRDLLTAPPVADLGEVDVLHTDVARTWARIADVVHAATQDGTPLVVIGGDHGLNYPVIEGLAKLRQLEIGMITFDAHYDVRPSHHGEPSSGTPFRLVLERALVSGRHCVQIGHAGWHSTKAGHDYALERGVRLMPAREVLTGDLSALLAEAIEIAGAARDGVWLSIDIDAVDTAFAPGVTIPTIGGLSTFHVLEAAWQLSRSGRLLGLEVTETSPPLDVAAKTAGLAAALVLNFLAGSYDALVRS